MQEQNLWERMDHREKSKTLRCRCVMLRGSSLGQGRERRQCVGEDQQHRRAQGWRELGTSGEQLWCFVRGGPRSTAGQQQPASRRQTRRELRRELRRERSNSQLAGGHGWQGKAAGLGASAQQRGRSTGRCTGRPRRSSFWRVLAASAGTQRRPQCTKSVSRQLCNLLATKGKHGHLLEPDGTLRTAHMWKDRGAALSARALRRHVSLQGLPGLPAAAKASWAQSSRASKVNRRPIGSAFWRALGGLGAKSSACHIS